jgi:hypothetical protein
MNYILYSKVSRKGGGKCFAIDETGFEYELPESLAKLNVGDKFSVPSCEAPTDGTLTHTGGLVIESGAFSELRVSGERKQFESVGQGASGSWEHRIGNSDYSTGTPWQHPNEVTAEAPDETNQRTHAIAVTVPLPTSFCGDRADAQHKR